MKNKKRLFVDMDGTLYRFHDAILDEEGAVQIDTMYEEDFFVNLPPFEEVVEGIQEFERDEMVEVFILSSVPNKDIEEQKRIVVHRDFPWIDDEHQIYVYPNCEKSDSAERRIGCSLDESCFLFDDYNKNLKEWVKHGGHSIKCVNNVNHNGVGKFGGDEGRIWEGDCISYQRRGFHMVLKEMLDGNIKNCSIPKIHQDALSVFHSDRETEYSVYEEKEKRLKDFFVQILKDPKFTACSIQPMLSNSKKVVFTKAFEKDEGKYRMTFFNRWGNEKDITPAYHHVFSSAEKCFERFPMEVSFCLREQSFIEVVGDCKLPTLDLYSFKNIKELTDDLNLPKEEFLKKYPFLSNVEYEVTKKEIEKENVFNQHTFYSVEYGYFINNKQYMSESEFLPLNRVWTIDTDLQDVIDIVREECINSPKMMQKEAYFVVTKEGTLSVSEKTCTQFLDSLNDSQENPFSNANVEVVCGYVTVNGKWIDMNDTTLCLSNLQHTCHLER